jgi:hypothetical protein
MSINGLDFRERVRRPRAVYLVRCLRPDGSLTVDPGDTLAAHPWDDVDRPALEPASDVDAEAHLHRHGPGAAASTFRGRGPGRRRRRRRRPVRDARRRGRGPRPRPAFQKYAPCPVCGAAVAVRMPVRCACSAKFPTTPARASPGTRAAREPLRSLLSEGVVGRARGIVGDVAGADDLEASEVAAAADAVYQAATPDAKILVGYAHDETMTGVRVTVIALNG